VIKALRPERRDDTDARERLLEEGRLLCSLSHPHLVKGYEFRSLPEPIVVMETLGGETVDHLIQRNGPLDASHTAQLGLQLGSAVRYLHANGVLHLDLKPSNVVAEAGRAKLIDLSLARPAGIVAAGVGTWCYLAPEQGRGGAVGPPADVWGLGAVLFETTTGMAPFEGVVDHGSSDTSAGAQSTGSSSLDTYTGPFEQLERNALRVDELATTPRGLADLIAACLATVPEERPRLHDVLARLEPLAGLAPAERRWAERPAAGGSPAQGSDLKPR
jgi:serine/threonine protein kinase